MTLIFEGETLYAQGDDNILAGSTVSGTAPSSTYSLATLLTMQPAARVRWGSPTVSVTFTLDAPARGDVFVLPVSNLEESIDGASPESVAVLTNGAGLSVALTIPALQGNGLPGTVCVDLTDAEPNATIRTSAVWTLTIANEIGRASCRERVSSPV